MILIDLVWIHDYHLIVLPKLLREKLGPDVKIGFFLHVPFPSSELFRCLHMRKEILEGVLESSLIGFQVKLLELYITSRLINMPDIFYKLVLDCLVLNVIRVVFKWKIRLLESEYFQ